MPKRSSADPAKLAAAVKACDPSLPASRRISQRAAAKRYGVPLGTLKSRIRRAREEGGDDEADASADASSVDETRADASSPNQRPPDGGGWQGVASTLPGDERLGAVEMQAAAMVVAGVPHGRIVDATGIPSRTLSRRKKDPVFLAVCADLRTACHIQARETLARGAEQAVRGMSAATELFERLNRQALDLLDRHEAGDEDATMDKVQAAVKAAVEASRLIPAGRALMDAGGFPKTERVEVEDTTDRGAGEVRGGAKDAAANLRLVVGGRAEKV